jgi:2-polyprenyl-3-methyl-5-hydroxy-6-metoxy-1,4-benzoquinol methylase
MSGREDESYGTRPLTRVDRLGVWMSARAVGQAVRRRFPERKVRALDLGCGYHASLLVELRPLLAQATCVDFHVSSQVSAMPGFRVIEGRVEEVVARLDAAAYDLVTLINVLEHLKDGAGAIVAIRRLLAPGGLLLINVPTWAGKRALEFSAFRLGLSPRKEMDDHKMYYGIRDLWPLLVRAGFRPSDLHLRHHKFGLNLFAEAVCGAAEP